MKISKQIGKPSAPVKSKRSGYVQTEQAAHEAWARLILDNSKAAALMHLIVSRMDRGSNALVISHKNLAALMGVKSERTVKDHLKVLEKDKWIQVISLGAGAMNAYVVNSAVAWGTSRERLSMAQFTAQVVASTEDQKALDAPNLRKIPFVFAGEQQLPSGDGLDPPSQPTLPDMEPDLPAITEEQQDLEL